MPTRRHLSWVCRSVLAVRATSRGRSRRPNLCWIWIATSYPSISGMHTSSRSTLKPWFRWKIICRHSLPEAATVTSHPNRISNPRVTILFTLFNSRTNRALVFFLVQKLHLRKQSSKIRKLHDKSWGDERRQDELLERAEWVWAHPLSSVTNTLTPEKSMRDWLPPDWEVGVIWMEWWLGDSAWRLSFTIKVTIDPFPTPSLSIHMWPSMRLTNLFHHTKLVRILLKHLQTQTSRKRLMQEHACLQVQYCNCYSVRCATCEWRN